MKRLLALLLATVLLLGLCACKAEAPEEPEEPEENVATEPAPTEPEPVYVPILAGIKVKVLRSNYEYTVGEDIILDEYGRIIQLNKRYTQENFVYNEDGTLASAASKDNDDGKTGECSWTYENGVAVTEIYRPNDGFTYDRDVTIISTTDEKGRVDTVTEKINYTDPEDNSKSKSTIEYLITYDDNDRIVSWEYRLDGEDDHITKFTYDENGNLKCYSNTGGSLGEYIRIEFIYTTIEESELKTDNLTPFQVCFNLEHMIGNIT